MIVLENVSVAYRKSSGVHEVLREVSARFEPGRNIGILGHKGSGKSTVIKLLGRLHRPDTGQVAHDGSLSWVLTSQRTFLRGVSVRSNLRFLATLYRTPAPALIRRVDELASLGPQIDTPIVDLPRDVSSRASYAACLALGFDHYFADESLFMGDPDFRERAKIYLARMRHKRSLIIATRHPGIIREYCDVAYVLSSATLRRYDDPKEAIRAFRQL